MPGANRWRLNCSNSTNSAMRMKSATAPCPSGSRIRRGSPKPIVLKSRSISPRTEPLRPGTYPVELQGQNKLNESKPEEIALMPDQIPNHAPVTDWVHDFDHTDPRWTENPFPIWDELRAECPVVHTKRFLGCYLPTTYEAVKQIAYDTEHFSSRRVIVRDIRPEAVQPARGKVFGVVGD